jgi:hypothetical protein
MPVVWLLLLQLPPRGQALNEIWNLFRIAEVTYFYR